MSQVLFVTLSLLVFISLITTRYLNTEDNAISTMTMNSLASVLVNRRSYCMVHGRRASSGVVPKSAKSRRCGRDAPKQRDAPPDEASSAEIASRLKKSYAKRT